MKRLTVFLAAAALLIPMGALAQSRSPEWGAHPPFHVKAPAQTTCCAGGYAPSQITSIYGFTFLGTTGANQVIAIVDAYDDPTIASDLAKFSSQWNLPQMNSCMVGTFNHCFQKVYAPSKPRTDGGWALEISLDVEWAHAIAPAADILLVEAKSSSLSSLLAAVKVATGTKGVRVVSMSWLGSEFSSESSYDSYFPPNNSADGKGIMYTASSGDSGAGTGWPAVSPRVLAVGGTTLNSGGTSTYVSETAWSGSGGGISTYEPEPAYQTAYNILGTGNKRAIPDVAYDADPSTGVYVYDSTSYQGQSGWWVLGGTSVGAPSWAAFLALVDQGRSSPLSTTPGSDTGSAIYNAASPSTYSANFHDIASGSNGAYSAGVGYDLVTGLGSPVAHYLGSY